VKKRVYIAGPITKGDLCHNLNQATEAFVTLAKAGFAPFCPHWSAYSKPAIAIEPTNAIDPRRRVYCYATIQGNDQMTHDDWLGVDLPWVEVADAVLRLPGESTGADREVAHANAKGIPVFESVEAVIKWSRDHS
jgi:hypothetical protein